MGDEGQAEAAGTGRVLGVPDHSTGTEVAFLPWWMCAAWGKKINPVSGSVFGVVMKPKAVFSVAAPKQTHGAERRSLSLNAAVGLHDACTHTRGRTGF